MSALLASLPPWYANVLSVVLFAVLLGWVWRMPFDVILADAPRARWRDLRLWATALVIVQTGLYWIFV